ncbi:hypothetical protein Lser_V15G10548 [Lactuca serriola]
MQPKEVLLLDNEIAFNEAIIEEREIHNQIGEVNEIFKDLAILVHEQGAMIDDIRSNIENSHAATAQARIQLSESIFIGYSSKVTEVVRSRCLNVQISAPKEDQIVRVLEFIGKKEFKEGYIVI